MDVHSIQCLLQAHEERVNEIEEVMGAQLLFSK